MADEKAKESFRERQAQELEVIKVSRAGVSSKKLILKAYLLILEQSIFGCDVEDLRPQANPSLWKPTDIRIQLTPLRDSSNGLETYVCTKLHVTCPSKYPKL